MKAWIAPGPRSGGIRLDPRSLRLPVGVFMPESGTPLCRALRVHVVGASVVRCKTSRCLNAHKTVLLGR